MGELVTACVRFHNWILLLTVVAFLPGAAFSQERDERAVKAAFVYNLTKYVEWPQASAEMRIGYVGERVTGETLKKMLDGKSSGPRLIRVVVGPSEKELEQCQIVYVAEHSTKNIRAVLEHVHGKSVLTVGDSELFVREGGIIGLVTVGEQVQIRVSLEGAQQAQLKISSRLLNIATLIPPSTEAKK